MQSSASRPEQYLASLPPDRRDAVSRIRDAIRAGLPDGYAEGMQYGMLGWCVPHSLCPDGYHCDPKQPVPFASVASQKQHIGIYLFCVYMDPEVSAWFQAEWKKTGKKLDMGKGCVRVRKIEDVPMELITQTVAKFPVQVFLSRYESSLPDAVRKKRGKQKG
jgi:uncharacterized protein YdhG (YjbR/CyaY superfamily)